MLLGTDISAVLTHARGAEGRRDRAELLDRARRTCATRSASSASSARCRSRASPTPGLPLQGPDGETIFPEQPEPLAEALKEFVERYGVGIVGGCCGTTPAHIARDRRARRRARRSQPRPAPRAAAPLLDDRRHAARAGAARRRWSASASTRRARARPRSCCWPTTTTGSCRSPRTRSPAARTCSTCAWR